MQLSDLEFKVESMGRDIKIVARHMPTGLMSEGCGPSHRLLEQKVVLDLQGLVSDWEKTKNSEGQDTTKSDKVA